MKKGFGKTLAVVAAAMGFALGSNAATMVPGNNSANVRIKDAIKPINNRQTVSESRKGYSGQSPYKHYRLFDRNQRQKRNWLRSVPQFRNSKKNPLK